MNLKRSFLHLNQESINTRKILFICFLFFIFQVVSFYAEYPVLIVVVILSLLSAILALNEKGSVIILAFFIINTVFLFCFNNVLFYLNPLEILFLLLPLCLPFIYFTPYRQLAFRSYPYSCALLLILLNLVISIAYSYFSGFFVFKTIYLYGIRFINSEQHLPTPL